jgi:uncharacterized protein YegJ (DUF2314 family)
MKWFFVAVVVIVLAVVGLLRLARQTDPTVQVPADDPQMAAAIAKARASQDQFLERIRNPPPTQSSASVKVMLRDDTMTEHVWLEEPRYEDGFFIGKLGNIPQFVSDYELGDVIRVPESDLSDWLAIDDGVLIGGYSIRVFRDRLPADKRAEFDRASPFRFQN